MFCVCLPPLQEIAHRYQPHSLQAELCSTLQQCSEAGEEARQRELAAAVMDVQLGRREALLEGLMELSGQLAATLQRYKSLVEGRGICVQSQSCGPSCDGLSLSLSQTMQFLCHPVYLQCNHYWTNTPPSLRESPLKGKCPQ